MFVTPFPILTLSKAEQPENVAPEKLVTLSGIMTLVRLVQPEKAYGPIVVIPSEMIMLERLVHPAKAPLPIVLTLSGMITLVMAPLLGSKIEGAAPDVNTLLPNKASRPLTG